MANFISKLKLFLFISLISLLLNICILSCLALYNIQNNDDYTSYDDSEIQTTNPKSQYNNVTAENFALATVGSFVPFVDLVNINLIPNLDIVVRLFLSLITGLFSALKLILISSMVASFIPFMNN